MVGCAGQMQARMPCDDLLNFCHSYGVSDVILRIGFRPAIGFRQYGLRCDAHDGAQFFASQLDESSIVLLGQGFRAGTADKDTNQFELFRCAMRKFL